LCVGVLVKIYASTCKQLLPSGALSGVPDVAKLRSACGPLFAFRVYSFESSNFVCLDPKLLRDVKALYHNSLHCLLAKPESFPVIIICLHCKVFFIEFMVLFLLL